MKTEQYQKQLSTDKERNWIEAIKSESFIKISKDEFPDFRKVVSDMQYSKIYALEKDGSFYCYVSKSGKPHFWME